MAAVAALLVERQPNSRVPRRVVRSGSWVARTSQAHARRSNERDREAGADEPAYRRVLPLPLGREARGELLRCCARFRASQAVHREHERREGASPGQAGPDVLLLLLLLVFRQDLVRVLTSVGGRVGISDSDVKDSRRALPPEPVGRNIAAEIWRGSAPLASALALPP